MRSFWPRAVLLLTLFLFLPTLVLAQKKISEPHRTPQLVRTTMRHEQRRLKYGGTLTIVGAPEGSITIEGWPNTDVYITAEVQLQADTEQDLDQLAAVNGFVLDEDSNHLSILSTGTHDKAYMRAVARKFPKALLGLPWKIDYRIRVPASIDLEINAGRGPITLSGVEGDIRLSATESETNLKLSGGVLAATIAKGNVTLDISERSWRRGGADIRVAFGDVTVGLPTGFNADIDAEILRSGQIVNSYGELEAREKPGITQQKIKARAGAGGAFFQFTVGDGTINIKKQAAESKP